MNISLLRGERVYEIIYPQTWFGCQGAPTSAKNMYRALFSGMGMLAVYLGGETGMKTISLQVFF